MLQLSTKPAQPESMPQGASQPDTNFIFFKSDRIYAHRVIRFNYTTYDVRRAQDVVNPSTSHCNILLLRPTPTNNDIETTSTTHPFLYARVIGIYHANIVYTGPGMLNYNPTRFDFLWVRWYKHIPAEGPINQQSPYRLDQLTFPPMTSEGAFGFIDPADVLRSCHIIPAFQQGNREGEGMSKFARDSGDWKAYFIDRSVNQQSE